jgi:hypothetical protein
MTNDNIYLLGKVFALDINLFWKDSDNGRRVNGEDEIECRERMLVEILGQSGYLQEWTTTPQINGIYVFTFEGDKSDQFYQNLLANAVEHVLRLRKQGRRQVR